MKRFLQLWLGVALLGAATCTHANAQQNLLPTLPNPTGGIVRWYLPQQTFPQNGFRIERTDPNGQKTSERLPSPMPKADVERDKLLEPDRYDYLSGLYRQAPKTNNERFQRGIFDLQAAVDPKLARVMGIWYEAKNLKPNTLYLFKVFAVGGSSETLIGNAELRPGKSPALTAPSGLRSSVVPGKISVSWQIADPNVVAYRVYRGEDNTPLVPVQPNPYFAEKDRINFVDTAFDPQKTYRYQVSSLDIFGRESQRSPEFKVVAMAAKPLSAPPLLAAQAVDDAVQLRWEKISDARVGQVLVLRGTNPDKLEVIARLPSTSSSYRDTSAVPATDYVYALQVQSGSSISPRGAGQMARAVNLTAPKSPQKLTISRSTTAIVLTWAANSERDLRGYVVYRSEQANTPLLQSQLLTEKPITTTRYTDTLRAGLEQTYFYRVLAINTTQIKSPPSQAVSGQLLDKTPPPAPTLLDASGLEGAVGLRFALAQTARVSHLEIFRVSPQGRVQFIAKVAPSTAGYVDKTAIPNLAYTYAVYSVDTAGNRSAPSNRMSAIAVLTKAPARPQNAKISLKDGSATISFTRAPTLFYIVYRVTKTGTLIQISQPLEVGKYIVRDAKKGERYALRAIDISGNLSQAVFLPI
jgi:fibronectin type 3 domain-containing protein